MAKLYNRVKMTTATTGTGTITLGSAVTGFQTFASAGASDGDVVSYVIEDSNGNVEIGRGTYTASGTTLSRTVTQSLISGTWGTTKLTLSGSAVVYNSALSADIIPIDANNNATVTGTLVMGSPFLRNRLINGAMAIDQRNGGTALTLTTTPTYSVDRWAAMTSTASSSTVTAQRIATGIVAFPYALRILRGSGSYTGSSIIIQEVETINCQDLAGTTVTVSFWLRKGSGFSPTSFYLQGISGSGTDQGIVGANAGTWTGWAAPVLTTISAASISTSFTQFTCTWAIPAGTNEIALYGVVNTYAGTGTANDYLDITGVQLEPGTAATPFERMTYGQEMLLCQRYYSVLGGETNADIVISGYNAASGASYYTFPLPVKMRASPTTTKAGTWTLTNCSQPSIGAVSSTTITLSTTVTATGAYQYNTTGTSTYITNSAEL